MEEEKDEQSEMAQTDLCHCTQGTSDSEDIRTPRRSTQRATGGLSRRWRPTATWAAPQTMYLTE